MNAILCTNKTNTYQTKKVNTTEDYIHLTLIAWLRSDALVVETVDGKKEFSNNYSKLVVFQSDPILWKYQKVLCDTFSCSVIQRETMSLEEI